MPDPKNPLDRLNRQELHWLTGILKDACRERLEKNLVSQAFEERLWRLAIRRWAGVGCHRLSRDGAERLRSQRGFRRVRVDGCQRGEVVDTRRRFLLHPTGKDLVA